ncbi:hypothetical protein KQX54_001848 [Cotesia glomerata]|uniref:EF-hand domain-containing protein n=1 Tax=Cotesia glomerata TaxID=32391 RepID=A0AAV7J1H9_COTGL|nr:hypothetical protein KQX54_001848 [Cotesia glomerata]
MAASVPLENIMDVEENDTLSNNEKNKENENELIIDNEQNEESEAEAFQSNNRELNNLATETEKERITVREIQHISEHNVTEEIYNDNSEIPKLKPVVLKKLKEGRFVVKKPKKPNKKSVLNSKLVESKPKTYGGNHLDSFIEHDKGPAGNYVLNGNDHNHPSPRRKDKTEITNELKRKSTETLSIEEIVKKLLSRKWNSLDLPINYDHEVFFMSCITKVLPNNKVDEQIQFIQSKVDVDADKHEDLLAFVKFLKKCAKVIIKDQTYVDENVMEAIDFAENHNIHMVQQLGFHKKLHPFLNLLRFDIKKNEELWTSPERLTKKKNFVRVINHNDDGKLTNFNEVLINLSTRNEGWRLLRLVTLLLYALRSTGGGYPNGVSLCDLSCIGISLPEPTLLGAPVGSSPLECKARPETGSAEQCFG